MMLCPKCAKADAAARDAAAVYNVAHAAAVVDAVAAAVYNAYVDAVAVYNAARAAHDRGDHKEAAPR